MKLVLLLHFISWKKNSFSDIIMKCFLPKKILRCLAIPLILGKLHFLLISEFFFFPEIKRNGMTSFMEFVICMDMGQRLAHPIKAKGLPLYSLSWIPCKLVIPSRLAGSLFCQIWNKTWRNYKFAWNSCHANVSNRRPMDLETFKKF